MEKLQNRVQEFLTRDNLSIDEKVQLFDDLYWANWAKLDKDYSKEIDDIFEYLKSEDLSLKEMAKVLSLYNNLDGAHITEFADIIRDLYTKDRIKFLKSLNLNPEEAINLVYIFKVYEVFKDGDEEYKKIENLNKLTSEELITANTFFNMYKTICHT